MFYFNFKWVDLQLFICFVSFRFSSNGYRYGLIFYFQFAGVYSIFVFGVINIRNWIEIIGNCRYFCKLLKLFCDKMYFLVVVM